LSPTERSGARSRAIAALLVARTRLPPELAALCTAYVRAPAATHCLADHAQTRLGACMCGEDRCGECRLHTTCDDGLWAAGCASCEYRRAPMCRRCAVRHRRVCAQEAKAREQAAAVAAAEEHREQQRGARARERAERPRRRAFDHAATPWR
jgi:hypothetical protein